MLKYVSSILPLFLLFAISTSHAVEPKTPKKAPTLGDYERAYTHIKKWSESFSDPQFYEDLEFQEGETKMSFGDLPDNTKLLFYLIQAETLSNKLFVLEKAWMGEFVKLRGTDPKPDAAPMDKKDKTLTEEAFARPATQENIQKYLKKLAQVRKNHAVQFEKYIDVTFPKLDKKITSEKSQKMYRDNLKKWHNEHKLVERPEQKGEK